MLKKTYGIAVRRKLEESLGLAVSNNRYSVSSDREKIQGLKQDAKELMQDLVRKTVPVDLMPDASDAVFAFFNKVLNPMYEELLACREDNDHPLRAIYRPKTDNGYSWGKTVGYERIPVETNSLVPRRFYEMLFEETGIPIQASF